MKRTFCLFLILLLLSGCADDRSSPTVTFFYPRTDYTYNSADGVIAPEVRDHGGNTSTAYLLGLYLKGPLDEKLYNPFPSGVTLSAVYTVNNTVYVTVSDTMAELSGAPLILACACIGRTAMKLSRTTQAQLRCDTLLLDGKESILINDDSFFYSDTYHQSQSEEPQA